MQKETLDFLVKAMNGTTGQIIQKKSNADADIEWVDNTGGGGEPGEPGVGVPAGGTTGQYLIKSSNVDYETEWSTLYTPEENIAVVYVSKVGNDTYSGTNIEKPKLTIGSAITNAAVLISAGAGGVRIEVVDGATYTENITIPENVFVQAPAARLNGTIALYSGGEAHFDRQYATANNQNLVTLDTASDGPAIFTCNVQDGRNFTGVQNIRNIGGGGKNLFVRVGILYVGENGIGVGDTTSGFGHIHMTIEDLYLGGNNAVGIQAGASGGPNVADIIGNIHHILEIGSPTGTKAIRVINANAIVKLMVAEIKADVAYEITAGSLHMICSRITGTRTGTPIFELSDVARIVPSGGTTGQVLAKSSDSDWQFQWIDAASGGSGLPDGGTTGQIIKKISNTNGDVSWQDENYPPPYADPTPLQLNLTLFEPTGDGYTNYTLFDYPDAPASGELTAVNLFTTFTSTDTPTEIIDSIIANNNPTNYTLSYTPDNDRPPYAPWKFNAVYNRTGTRLPIAMTTTDGIYSGYEIIDGGTYEGGSTTRMVVKAFVLVDPDSLATSNVQIGYVNAIDDGSVIQTVYAQAGDTYTSFASRIATEVENNTALYGKIRFIYGLDQFAFIEMVEPGNIIDIPYFVSNGQAFYTADFSDFAASKQYNEITPTWENIQGDIDLNLDLKNKIRSISFDTNTEICKVQEEEMYNINFDITGGTVSKAFEIYRPGIAKITQTSTTTLIEFNSYEDYPHIFEKYRFILSFYPGYTYKIGVRYDANNAAYFSIDANGFIYANGIFGGVTNTSLDLRNISESTWFEMDIETTNLPGLSTGTSLAVRTGSNTFSVNWSMSDAIQFQKKPFIEIVGPGSGDCLRMDYFSYVVLGNDGAGYSIGR